jgi:hypothetical protein
MAGPTSLDSNNGKNIYPVNFSRSISDVGYMASTMKKAFEEAQAKLRNYEGNPTQHYLAYMRFEEEYRRAVKARDDAYANALSDPMTLRLWPIEGRIYQDNVESALDRWVSLGFKYEIENAIAILAAQGDENDAKAD